MHGSVDLHCAPKQKKKNVCSYIYSPLDANKDLILTNQKKQLQQIINFAWLKNSFL